jgi:hypothetical protein
MFICKPAAEVFEAFINSAVTPERWFIKSSGRLESGKREITANGLDFYQRQVKTVRR